MISLPVIIQEITPVPNLYTHSAFGYRHRNNPFYNGNPLTITIIIDTAVKRENEFSEANKRFGVRLFVDALVKKIFVTTWSCFRNWFEKRHLRSRHFSVSFMIRAADYTFCSRGTYRVSKHMVCY